MPRRSRSRQDRLGQLLTQVERRFQNSPLNAVAHLLITRLTEVQASAEAGFTSPESVEHVVTYTTFVLDSLPSTFGDRFIFDAQFLSALAEDCSQGGAQFSPNLIPKPSETWGHQTVIPCPDGKRAFALDVIHMPGEDNLQDVDLLDYPFACHEMGHNLLFKQGDAFAASFSIILDEIIVGLQRQLLSRQGPSRQIAETTIEQIRQFWTPTANHYNWAHEIAADVIAAWTCGPAYLAALQEVLERSETNPYQLGQSHPPYELRAKAMVDTANQLGWAYYTGGLQNLIYGWPKSSWAGDLTNLYAGCADPRLVQQNVSAAIEACRSFALPLCTTAVVDSIREKLRHQTHPDLGLETIIAAWIARSESQEEAFEAWERGVVRDHLASLTE